MRLYPISPGPFPSPWPIKRFYLQKYILDCHSILEYLILSENNHPSINHDFLRKNRLGFRCPNFGFTKTRTNPLGTTVLYQKSNKSPTRKIASASLYLIEPCHESLFSWQTMLLLAHQNAEAKYFFIVG
jgi:hypothetical protein